MPKHGGVKAFAFVVVGTALVTGCGPLAARVGRSPQPAGTTTGRTSPPLSSTAVPSSVSPRPSDRHATPVRPTPTASASRPSSSAIVVPGLGALPPANAANVPMTVRVTQVLAPSQLIVNGSPVTPPIPQAEPVVVKMTLTAAHGGGAIIPLPSFGYATTNAAPAPTGLGQTTYGGGPGPGVWSQYHMPYPGVPPRIVIGTHAVTFWAISWVERPTNGTMPIVAVIWDGTATGRPGGVIAAVAAQPTGAFPIRTQVSGVNQ